MAMKRHRQPLEIMSAMNITNLLDTAFILLITFMLVAPQLTHGIKLQLPEVEKAPPLDTDQMRSLLISIQVRDQDEAEERVYIKNQRVTLREVTEIVASERAARADLGIIIEADQESRSGMFMQVVGAVKQAGVETFGIKVRPGAGER